MKNMRKILALLMAVAMILSLSVAAFATDGPAPAAEHGDGKDHTIYVKAADSAHTYEAYQVFVGTMDDQGRLGSIHWGDNVDTSKLPAAYKDKEASEVADMLANDNSLAATFADDIAAALTGDPAASTSNYTDFEDRDGNTVHGYILTVIDSGYYLVTDKATVFDPKDTHHAYTDYILEIVRDVYTTPKSGTPTVEKKVWDQEDSDASVGEWKDSADYDIGDKVPFKLTATLPRASALAAYDHYKVVFHDTMNTGLAMDKTSTDLDEIVENNYITVQVDGKDVTNFGPAGNLAIEVDDHELTLTIHDIFALTPAPVHSGTATHPSTITVEYAATLTEAAIVGMPNLGNADSFNWNKVFLEFSNDPNHHGDGTPSDNPPTGKTPEDTVVVFTVTGIFDKYIKGTDTKLPGANFAVFKKYAAGVEPPAGAVAYEVDKFTNLNLNATQKEEFEQYEGVVDGGTYYLVEEITDATLDRFEFKGLDDGEYLLVETKVPSGYNGIAPIPFVIDVEHGNDSNAVFGQAIHSLSIKGTNGAVTTGTAVNKIENGQGASLPTTGGMGTTLFYIVGSFMAFGAAVLLITKKRMA